MGRGFGEGIGLDGWPAAGWWWAVGRGRLAGGLKIAFHERVNARESGWAPGGAFSYDPFFDGLGAYRRTGI